MTELLSLLDLQEDAGLGEPEYVVRQGLQLFLGNAEHRVRCGV